MFLAQLVACEAKSGHRARQDESFRNQVFSPALAHHLYMAGTLLERMWFTCKHQFSWPRRADDGGYYQVCLHCGVQYGYDWSAMRRIARLRENGDADNGNHSGNGNGNGNHNGNGHDDGAHASPAAAGKRPVRKCGGKTGWQPRERRLRLQAPVLYRQQGKPEWQHGVAENISRSGLLFQGDQTFSSGVPLEMIFSMPAEICGEHNSNVLCRGTVVRTQAGKNRGYMVAVAIAGYELLPKGKVAGM